MSGFFVVKGELAAWALGLDESDALTTDEMVELYGRPELPAPKRRNKRRLGHEFYRTPLLRRRELAGR